MLNSWPVSRAMLVADSGCRAYCDSCSVVKGVGVDVQWGGYLCRRTQVAYMSLFTVGADVSLQARDHPLVHVVGHHTHHFHTSLDLHKQQGKGGEENQYHRSALKPVIISHPWLSLTCSHCWTNSKQITKTNFLRPVMQLLQNPWHRGGGILRAVLVHMYGWAANKAFVSPLHSNYLHSNY